MANITPLDINIYIRNQSLLVLFSGYWLFTWLHQLWHLIIIELMIYSKTLYTEWLNGLKHYIYWFFICWYSIKSLVRHILVLIWNWFDCVHNRLHFQYTVTDKSYMYGCITDKIIFIKNSVMIFFIWEFSFSTTSFVHFYNTQHILFKK